MVQPAAFLKHKSCHSMLKITSQWNNPSINASRAPPCPQEGIQSFQLELKAWAPPVSPALALLSLPQPCPRGTPQPCRCHAIAQTCLALLCLPFCLSRFPCPCPSSPSGGFLPNFECQLDLTFSGKPSLVALGRVYGFLFFPFFSSVTTHAFITVCQLACLHCEFPVSATWLCPQQGQHRRLKQLNKICWLVE